MCECTCLCVYRYVYCCIATHSKGNLDYFQNFVTTWGVIKPGQVGCKHDFVGERPRVKLEAEVGTALLFV